MSGTRRRLREGRKRRRGPLRLVILIEFTPAGIEFKTAWVPS